MYRTISPCPGKAFSADCIFRKSIRRASSSASFAAECSTSPSICGRGSETYGKWFGVELSAENKKQFYIPQGFAHGFLVLSDEAEFCYKCTDLYHPEDEGGIAWNDPAIGIEWPELVGWYDGTAERKNYALKDGTKITLSQKDMCWSRLEEYRGIA